MRHLLNVLVVFLCFCFVLQGNAIAAKKKTRSTQAESNILNTTAEKDNSNTTAEKSNLNTTITVTGTGLTKNDAIQDAFRNAIERAVGVLVYSVTETKNFQIERDQIIAMSRGYVHDYTITDERKADALYYVTVSVNVNAEKIRAIIRSNVKVITYDNVIKDIALIQQRQDQLKKYQKLLEQMRWRPLNDKYIIEYAGYEVTDIGLEKVQFTLRVRIAPNVFFWDTYNRILKLISSDNTKQYEKGLWTNYNIHPDLLPSLIKPFIGLLDFEYKNQPSGYGHRYAAVYAFLGAKYTNRCMNHSNNAQIEWGRPIYGDISCSGGSLKDIPVSGLLFEFPTSIKNAEQLKNFQTVKLKLHEYDLGQNWFISKDQMYKRSYHEIKTDGLGRMYKP